LGQTKRAAARRAAEALSQCAGRFMEMTLEKLNYSGRLWLRRRTIVVALLIG